MVRTAFLNENPDRLDLREKQGRRAKQGSQGIPDLMERQDQQVREVEQPVRQEIQATPAQRANKEIPDPKGRLARREKLETPVRKEIPEIKAKQVLRGRQEMKVKPAIKDLLGTRVTKAQLVRQAIKEIQEQLEEQEKPARLEIPVLRGLKARLVRLVIPGMLGPRGRKAIRVLRASALRAKRVLEKLGLKDHQATQVLREIRDQLAKLEPPVLLVWEVPENKEIPDLPEVPVIQARKEILVSAKQGPRAPPETRVLRDPQEAPDLRAIRETLDQQGHKEIQESGTPAQPDFLEVAILDPRETLARQDQPDQQGPREMTTIMMMKSPRQTIRKRQ